MYHAILELATQARAGKRATAKVRGKGQPRVRAMQQARVRVRLRLVAVLNSRAKLIRVHQTP